MSFISSFEVIKVVVPDPRSFLFIAASVTDAAAVIPSIPKGLITLFNNGNPVFSSGPKSLPKKPADVSF